METSVIYVTWVFDCQNQVWNNESVTKSFQQIIWRTVGVQMKIFQFQCGDEGSKMCTLRVYNCVQLQKNSRKPLQCEENCGVGEWKGTVHTSGFLCLVMELYFLCWVWVQGPLLCNKPFWDFLYLFYYTIKGRRKS